MPRISSTSVLVDGSCPSRWARSGSASHSSARISAYSAALEGKCLNSSPSEMAAAAATLLVVVPAKPLRAKQRLAAPRISWRRKSEVMRRLDMGRVSNYSPWQSQGNILHRIKELEDRWRRNPLPSQGDRQLTGAQNQASRGCD